MRRKILNIITIPLIIWSACSSKNDEADILSYSIINYDVDVQINGADKSIIVSFPDNLTEADDGVAEFVLSDGAIAKVDGIIQENGISSNNFETQFVFKVESEDKSINVDWRIIPKNNSYTLPWGLGGFQNSTISNNRSYEWYLDQAYTGTYSYVNCGPTSTTMAAKWSLPTFSKTPEDARAAYRPTGGWWYTSDIANYLADNSIPYGYLALSGSASGTSEVISGAIDRGYILILCVDMYYVRNGSDSEYRVDKFYDANTVGWGHFIVVKGYRFVDKKLFFEIYDPYCYNLKYNDNSLKGKNRYYRSDDIFLATYNWWNYAITISEYGAKGMEIKGPDPALVPSACGR